MANYSKNMIIGSAAVAGLVVLAALLDLVLGIPFGPSPPDAGSGRMIMDITFILGGAAVLYMGWDAYRDLR